MVVTGYFLSEIKASIPTVKDMLALIIDEFQDLPRSISTALRENGYVLEAARSRGEVLWLLEASDFDAVIYYTLDMEQTEQLVAAVRQISEAPLMILVQDGDAAMRISALDAGADDIMMMPGSGHEVLARLRALSRRAPGLTSLVITQGTLRLDMAERAAYRDGETGEEIIELTARETALLELMMRHPRVVLTRSRLIEHIWGTDMFVHSNGVDQVVSRLRTKLGRPFGVNEIVTVRGMGYRFEPVRDVLKHAS